MDQATVLHMDQSEDRNGVRPVQKRPYRINPKIEHDMDNDAALATMIRNLEVNTGKSLSAWISIAQKTGLQKHGELLKHLKTEHGLTHGYANLVAMKARGADAGSKDAGDLVAAQYKGKEHFKPIYDRILREVKKFGKDVEIAPKNNSVSLRRKKQFGLLSPATKTRFEIGLNMEKGKEVKGAITITGTNSMCSHRIDLHAEKDLDQRCIDLLRQAYEQAG